MWRSSWIAAVVPVFALAYASAIPSRADSPASRAIVAVVVARGDLGKAAVARDVERASTACPDCAILLVQASSSDMTDLADARSTATALGARVMSDD